MLPTIEEALFGEHGRIDEFRLQRLRVTDTPVPTDGGATPKPNRMRELNLTEYATSRGVELEKTDLDLLRRQLPTLGISPQGENLYDLTPASVVGAFDAPTMSVVVRPNRSTGCCS